MLSQETQKYLRLQITQAKAYMDRARQRKDARLAIEEVDSAVACLSKAMERIVDAINRQPNMY